MVRRIKKVTKDRATRKRKKIIVLGAEGLNKTEFLYFRELEKKQSQYHFIFALGNETDPVRIVKNTAKKAKDEALQYNQGDMAFSVFDLDVNETKYIQLETAKTNANKMNIGIITSNPCFEVWYLEHFGFSTKPFLNSNAVVKELEKKMPGYQKNRCDFDILFPHTEAAIKNSEMLEKYHVGNNETYELANPRTDVYKIVRILMKGDDK